MLDIEFLYRVYKQHPVVSTDSRRTPDGCLFFALKGASFDGNQFAAKALEGGAAVAVVDDASVVPSGSELTSADGRGRYVVVDDVLEALQALAAHHRRQYHRPVVQVTGTNGKTTTKELLAAVLSRKYKVLYTEGNLNNHIGVPLTLLRLRPEEHEIAIIETGANHPGEIAFLTSIVRPDYGLITNVGRAHLEGFGSFEGVKHTKGELYDYLQQQAAGRIFVCASNADLTGMLAERGVDPASEKCISYAHAGEGLASTLCTGQVASCSPTLTVTWQHGDGAANTTATKLIGDYNLDNVLAAACVGLHFGVAESEIDKALTAYQPTLGRSEYRRTASNELIVDAYNANLTSMMAALKNFAAIQHEHKMVILGDMKELGAASGEAHRRVAEAALACGAEEAWFVGGEFSHALPDVSMHLGASACAPKRIGPRAQVFSDVHAVAEAIAACKPEGRLILIKGSNSTRLHQLPELL